MVLVCKIKQFNSLQIDFTSAVDSVVTAGVVGACVVSSGVVISVGLVLSVGVAVSGFIVDVELVVVVVETSFSALHWIKLSCNSEIFMESTIVAIMNPTVQPANIITKHPRSKTHHLKYHKLL